MKISYNFSSILSITFCVTLFIFIIPHVQATLLVSQVVELDVVSSFMFASSIERTHGFLDLDVIPEEAEVYVNGELKGTCDQFDGVPDYLYLKPGKYRITFRLKGFLDYDREITVQAGREIEFNTRLKTIPLNERPQDHEEFQGEEPTPYPEQGETDSGDSEVEPTLEHPDKINPSENESSIDRPASKDIGKTSNGTSGYVKCRIFPKDASVYINNVFFNIADEINNLENGIHLPSGKHTINIMKPGFISVKQEVEVKPDETTILRIILLPEQINE